MSRAAGARRRALGQHFLVDREVARRTVELAEVAGTDRVLEIGPGRGILTGCLLATGASVVAVELDEELAERLAPDPGLRVVQADFLRFDIAALPPGEMAVVANLPYSTGTAILERLLEHPARFPRIVVMLQLEVAERLCASPGSRSYGSLTVLTAMHAQARFGFTVPPAAFRPPPKVDSAVVRLDVSPALRPEISDPVRFRRVVRAAFSQRRKTLRNSLGASLGASLAVAALTRAGIDPMRRAETLALGEFARLADEVERGA